jgi:hypothetical protein
MVKPKASPSAPQHREPVHKKTRQGAGRGSKPSHGRKLPAGQGR